MAELVAYNTKEKLEKILRKIGKSLGHVLKTGHLDPHWFGEHNEAEYHRANKLFRTITNGKNKRKHDEIEEHHGEQLALSNSPASEEMVHGHHEDALMHGGDAPGITEGGEKQIEKPHHIWRRFPNTETAALKWIYTNYLTDVAGTQNISRTPFDQTGTTSTTDLITSGGGAWSAIKGNNITGADGATTTTPTGHDYVNPVLLQYRMTTPYNIWKTLTGNGLVNTQTGTSQPCWLEMFDTRYQFYHVMETEWEITFNFGIPFWNNGGTGTALTATTGSMQAYYIFWKYTSNDSPPVSYSIGNTNIANVNNSTTGLNVNDAGTQISGINVLSSGAQTVQMTPDDYFRMGGWHHKHVRLNSTHNTHVRINGTYKFGQCKMDIKTQEPTAVSGSALQTEGWLQSGSTYTFPEDLSIIIVADNATNGGAGILTPVGTRIETEQLIQFKDLRSAYKFPTPANAFIGSATTLNTDAMFFNRGATYT